MEIDDYLEEADNERKRRQENGECVRCGQPLDAMDQLQIVTTTMVKLVKDHKAMQAELDEIRKRLEEGW